MRADNIKRFVASEGVEAIAQVIKLLQPAPTEDEAWDALLRGAWDYPHRKAGGCECILCRPNRRYR